MKAFFMRNGVTIVVAVVAFLASSAQVLATSDEPQLAKAIVGSWVFVLDPNDEVGRNAIILGLNAVDQYKANGEGVATVYRGDPCDGKVFKTAAFAWTLHDQTLVTAGKEHSDRSHIRLVAGKVMEFEAAAGKSTTRYRKLACPES